MVNLKTKYLFVLTGLLLMGIVFSVIQLTRAAPAAPNPGHTWNEIECDNNLCVNTATGRVGIGTTTPAAKLEVAGNIIAKGPTASNHVATRGYVDGQVGGGKVIWEGYTASTYNGFMAGVGGMNSKCNANYPGSHACRYDEIVALGTSYPWSQNAWVVDGGYVADYRVVDGVSSYLICAQGGSVYGCRWVGPTQTGDGDANCRGWWGAISTEWGWVAEVGYKSLFSTQCHHIYRIPCCR